MLSSGEHLQTLLKVQESLNSSVLDEAFLTDALPGILTTILETMGCQHGQLFLISRESDQAIVMSSKDGCVNTEMFDSIPEILQGAIDNIDAKPERDFFITNSQSKRGILARSLPETTSALWSEISVPLRTENLSFGILSFLKPGTDQFAKEDILLASLFAGQVASALTAVKFKTDWQSAEAQVQEILHDNQDLAAILVHDLQGPLGNVLSSLELLEAEVNSEEGSSLSLMMDIAIRSSKLLEALVNSLLDISRLEAGQEITNLEQVAVSDIVDYVAEVEGPVLEQRQVTLVREIDNGLPLVNVNVGILRRVLLNLLDNALKVSKRGQKIVASAFFDSDNGDVRIYVIDQGPGIPEAYHDRIFEKYQRVEDSSPSKGLGLGLAFCKLAVEAHGGRIWVEKASEQGTCFCLILPVDNHKHSNALS